MDGGLDLAHEPPLLFVDQRRCQVAADPLFDLRTTLADIAPGVGCRLIGRGDERSRHHQAQLQYIAPKPTGIADAGQPVGFHDLLRFPQSLHLDQRKTPNKQQQQGDGREAERCSGRHAH